MRELLRRLRALCYRAQFERDLEDEMAHHLAMLAEDRSAAPRRQFGNLALLQGGKPFHVDLRIF